MYNLASSPHIKNAVVNTFKRPGKHKIPRYLYHFTNKACYEKMLADKFIKRSSADLFNLNGIYMVDISNFLKSWKDCKIKNLPHDDLRACLITQSLKYSNDLVVLKIPSDSVCSKYLKIRSEDKFFKAASEPNGINNYADQFSAILHPNENLHLETIYKKYKKQFIDFLPKQVAELLTGEDVSLSKLYKQKNEAIEYVAMHDIPVNRVKKIAEINLEEFMTSEQYDAKKPFQTLMKKLFASTAEAKNVEFMK